QHYIFIVKEITISYFDCILYYLQLIINIWTYIYIYIYIHVYTYVYIYHTLPYPNFSPKVIPLDDTW
ncbi:MAG: hypothetical protein N7Q72_03830, partial [Spiroplasma sp. Tabriz.8]|nr:hypothetical protein [Spiroplasma sp. Tabriz.8]